MALSTRLQLQSLLEEILGTRDVYFQPPANVQMKYPCIVYNRDAGDTKFADDKPYSYMQRYQITLIDQDPDSSIFAKLVSLPRCTFTRFFTADDLNHDIFTLFF